MKRDESTDMERQGAVDDASSSLPLSYRIARRFYRFLTNIWFREINIVDDENLPPEGGRLYITWHPSGLIDPMLMTTVLPGRLTTVAKHTLFRIPFLGRLLKASGVVPIERPQDAKDAEAARQRNADRISNLSSTLAQGGSVLIFPEGVTHADAGVRRVRSGAARILLAALREAEAAGLPKPNVVPVGLHYSESQRFRERAAVVVERSMDLPDTPQLEGDLEQQDAADRAWVDEVTEVFSTELQRVNLSKTSWAERTMIWRGRSLVYAEKQRQIGEELRKPTFAESVLAARRLRAGWEFMAASNPEETEALAKRCQDHFDVLEHRGITPYDVDARPEQLSLAGYGKYFFQWLWALVWMFGLITWSAIAGNYVPYKANGFFSLGMKRMKVDTSVVGTMKVLSAMVVFPIWWMVASAFITWSLLSASSPLNELLLSHWLLLGITKLPAIGVFIVFLFWWPVSAKLHLKLYARLLRGSHNLQRWKIWKDDTKDWDLLVEEQRLLSAELVNLGSGLVLPGDPDWEDPAPGQDDVASVRFRQPGPTA
jgi:1-acyl-sn-glycerol-3-phosphate acyltransferase